MWLRNGEILTVPASWSLLPPGDAGLTGRVKKAGPTWTVQEKRGRKLFSRGVWAPAEVIEAIRRELLVEREDPSYARKLESGRRRRAAEQERYEEDFAAAVRSFLAFSPVHGELARRSRTRITRHAVPEAAAPSRGPNASRIDAERKRRRSRGCGTRPRGTTTWRSLG